MEFKQLEAFLAVLETKSFSRAAEQLYVTQPAISAQISSLETELNAKLFVRSRKSVELTKAGHILQRYAYDLLARRDMSLQMLNSYRNATSGIIRIGASSIPIHHYVPKLIRGFQKQHHNVLFRLQLMDSIDIVENVVSGQLEIGFTGIYVPSPWCMISAIAYDQWVVITPNNARFKNMQRQGFLPSSITQEAFITRAPGSGWRKDMDHFLSLLGIPLQELSIVAELDDTEAIIQMVSAGIGVSIVSKRAAEGHSKQEKILYFDLGDIISQRGIYIVKSMNIPLSAVANEFYEHARREAERRPL